MKEFRKYMHLERYGNDEVQGIELGRCYVFPKLDGTNASVWNGGDGDILAGSRNRLLSIEEDNAGFYQAMLNDDSIAEFLSYHPSLRLYGEWLVPHSLKTYRDEAWRKFYVFDVFDDDAQEFLPYEKYADLLSTYDIEVIRPLAVIQNATYENLLREVEGNSFLIQDGKGAGEGVVIKNYQFKNRFGRVCWAKIVTNEFKEKHVSAMGCKELVGTKMVEQEIVDKYVTQALADKVFAKIVNEHQGWNSKYIPRLLETVFYDLVNEEAWNFVKAHKMPTVNFKTLHTLCIMRVKELKPELF